MSVHSNVARPSDSLRRAAAVGLLSQMLMEAEAAAARHMPKQRKKLALPQQDGAAGAAGRRAAAARGRQGAAPTRQQPPGIRVVVEGKVHAVQKHTGRKAVGLASLYKRPIDWERMDKEDWELMQHHAPKVEPKLEAFGAAAAATAAAAPAAAYAHAAPLHQQHHQQQQYQQQPAMMVMDQQQEEDLMWENLENLGSAMAAGGAVMGMGMGMAVDDGAPPPLPPASPGLEVEDI
mmetsp:Transcript_14621/g.36400  ORF Transcript_14621/g.36400 Transcript_14621/m.36400 type:complete len:234 (-) Transcript_14621:449-1150(-)